MPRLAGVITGGSLVLLVVMAASAPARAVTLDSWTNSTPTGSYSLSFTALDPSTTISFAGYNVPSLDNYTDIGLFLNGAGPNLLGSTWVFIPAAQGSSADQYSDGTGVNALQFMGTSSGYYDTFSQTIATTVGGPYTLDFTYGSDGGSSDNGFIVTASNAVTSATPLPSTWTMLIAGFLGLGLFAYRGAKKSAAALAAG